MRYLGELENIPFFMVRAGKHLFQSEPADKGPGRHVLSSAAPLSKRAESRGSEGSDTSLSTLATVTTADDENSVVVESIEHGEPQHKTTYRSLTPAKRSLSGRSAKRFASPTVFPTRHASSAVTQSDHKTPSPHISLVSRPKNPRQSTVAKVPVPLAVTQPAFVPLALALTVLLSKDSFAHSCGTKTKHIPQDVKIDVFFNGEMTASTYVSARYRGEANNMIQLTQRFSGRRVDRMAERPWVVVAPSQTADGSLRMSKTRTSACVEAHERWNQIGQALEKEGERYGRNKYGDRSVIGDYLASLAKLEMPTEVDHMQKEGGLKFGVIDVVITLGKGQKDEPEKGYLKEPTKLRLRGFHDDGRHKEEKSTKESMTGPSRNGDCETTVLDLTETPKCQFAMPVTPSAAPSAVRRRESLAIAGHSSPSMMRARPRRLGSLPSNSNESQTAISIHSSSLSDSPTSTGDLRLVPVGNPIQNLAGRREIGLPSLILRKFSFDKPSSGTSRIRPTNVPYSRKTRAALGTEVGSTRGQHNDLRSQRSSSPNLIQPCFTSDPSVVTLSQSSPPRVIRPRNRRVSWTTPVDDGPALSGGDSKGDKHRSFDNIGLLRDVATTSTTRRSRGSRSLRRARARASADTIQKSTATLLQKRDQDYTAIPSGEPNFQRRLYPTGWSVSDKPTLAEEIAQIEASSRSEISAAISKGATSTFRTEKTDKEQTTAQEDDKETSTSQAVRLKVKGPLTPLKTHPPAANKVKVSVRDESTHTGPHQSRIKPTLSKHNATLTKSASKPVLSSPIQPRRRRRSTVDTPLPAHQLPVWQTPALSQGSVLSYADEASLITGDKHGNGTSSVERGAYRQARAERNGWFEESSVLMGVRFVVG